MGSDFADSCSNIENLVIPNTVKYVAQNAFAGLNNLRTVRFMGDLKYLGASIFELCYSPYLKEIYLPNNIENLNDSAFTLDMYTIEEDLEDKPLKFITPRTLYEKHKKAFSNIEIFNSKDVYLEIV